MITIHGQSAGGSSMGLHLSNYNSSSLITNIIMQSNPFGIPMKTKIEAKKQANLFANELKCLKTG